MQNSRVNLSFIHKDAFLVNVTDIYPILDLNKCGIKIKPPKCKNIPGVIENTEFFNSILTVRHYHARYFWDEHFRILL
jgi:hypothetical protein